MQGAWQQALKSFDRSAADARARLRAIQSVPASVEHQTGPATGSTPRASEPVGASSSVQDLSRAPASTHNVPLDDAGGWDWSGNPMDEGEKGSVGHDPVGSRVPAGEPAHAHPSDALTGPVLPSQKHEEVQQHPRRQGRRHRPGAEKDNSSSTSLEVLCDRNDDTEGYPSARGQSVPGAAAEVVEDDVTASEQRTLVPEGVQWGDEGIMLRRVLVRSLVSGAAACKKLFQLPRALQLLTEAAEMEPSVQSAYLKPLKEELETQTHDVSNS